MKKRNIKQEDFEESMLKLVLASASPRRVELLNQIGLEFDIVPADIDENSVGFTEAGKYAEEMSKRKALQVAESLREKNSEDALVLGADTVVSVEQKIFGKPADRSQAEYMLRQLENKWHEVTTGLTIVRTKTMEISSEREITRVKVPVFEPGFLDRYLSTREPYDKAGAYAIQGYGSLMVKCIDGCYFNVMGLPLYRLSRMLSGYGYNPLSWIKGI